MSECTGSKRFFFVKHMIIIGNTHLFFIKQSLQKSKLVPFTLTFCIEERIPNPFWLLCPIVYAKTPNEKQPPQQEIS